VTLLRCASAALVVALLAGCGLGDRQQRADAIISSVDAAFAARQASGTLTTSMRFVRLPDGAGVESITGGAAAAGVAGAGIQQAMQQELTVATTLDLARGRAQVALQSHADAPFALYDGLVSYGRRWSAGPRDARPWVRVDGTDITKGEEVDPTQDAPSFFAFALNPIVLVDLIAGPLAGSVRDLGVETIDGAETTRYSANFDIDKVVKKTRRKRYPEETRRAFEDVLKVLAVSGPIHKGEVWIDGDGRPRRFTIRLKEEPIRHFVIEHTITLDLQAFGTKAAVALPSARERIDVRSVVQYLRATIPSPRTPEFLTFLGMKPQPQPPAAPSAG